MTASWRALAMSAAICATGNANFRPICRPSERSSRSVTAFSLPKVRIVWGINTASSAVRMAGIFIICLLNVGNCLCARFVMRQTCRIIPLNAMQGIRPKNFRLPETPGSLKSGSTETRPYSLKSVMSATAFICSAKRFSKFKRFCFTAASSAITITPSKNASTCGLTEANSDKAVWKLPSATAAEIFGCKPCAAAYRAFSSSCCSRLSLTAPNSASAFSAGFVRVCWLRRARRLRAVV